MRDRLGAVGDRIELSSQPRQGTLVAAQPRWYEKTPPFPANSAFTLQTRPATARTTYADDEPARFPARAQAAAGDSLTSCEHDAFAFVGEANV